MQLKPILVLSLLFISLIGTAHAGTITCSGNSWTSISDALDYASDNPGSTLELAGSFTVDANQYYIPPNTEITGDATITLSKQNQNAETPSRCRAIFNAKDGADNIKIHGFTIDGNSENDWSVWGNDHVNMIQLFGSSNVEIYDMTFKNGLGDAIKIRHGSSDGDQDSNTNIKIYNNVIDRIGHDGIYLFCVADAEIYGNTITCRDDSGIRIFNSNNIKIHDNNITSKNQGGAGIEIQKNEDVKMDNVEIYNNKIYHIRNSGIWCYGYEDSGAGTSYIYIHDNEISDCALNAGGGVSIQAINVFLEENTIKDNRNYDVGILNCWKSFKGSGYKIALDSNDLSKDVFNQLAGTHSITYSSDGVKPDKDILPPKDDNDNGNGEGEDDVNVIPSDDNTTDEIIEPDNEDIDPVETFNSIFDVLDMDFSDTAYIEQGVMNPTKEWETKGKYTRAWIDIPGYEGLLKIGNNTYIPKSPEDCAIVMYDTENIADRPKGQTATEKVYTEDGVLKVDLTVKTKYEVQAYKTYIVLGQKVRIPYYKTKSETVTFTKSFENVPDIFPAFNPPKVYVTNYNRSHVIIYIPTIDGIVRADTDYNYSSCTERRLIGYIGTATNGFRSTDFERIDSWAFSGPQMSRSSKGVYITEDNFDINKLNVTVVTPYDSFKITDFEYEVIEDDSRKIINYALFAFVVCIWIYGRAIYKVLYMLVGRWF